MSQYLHSVKKMARVIQAARFVLPRHPLARSFGRTYRCPLEVALVPNRQRWGYSSGGSGDRAAAIPLFSGGVQRPGISIGSWYRSRSPHGHPGYSSALAFGTSARFQAQGARLHRPRSRAQPVTRLCPVSDTSAEPVSSSTRRDTDNTVPVTAAQGFAVATRLHGGKQGKSPADVGINHE